MSDALFLLPIDEQLTPNLTLRKKDDLPIIVIDHPNAKAAIALQGAHLLSWQPKDEASVIWLSQNSAFKAGVPIRGGIPICWPWFGKTAEDTLPSHGFARNVLWQLSAHDENDECLWLTFSLQDNEYTRQIWPYAFSLIARIKIGTTCEIELESHGNYPMTAALHTYFNIGDIHQVSVEGLGKRYFDKLSGQEVETSETRLTFPGPLDRIYSQPEPFSLINDPVNNRTIEVHHRNATDVVVWNPGVEGAAKLDDMANTGYQTMVCVETARISQATVVQNDRPAYFSTKIQCYKNN